MIDLANYPMLPSLSRTTSGRRYGGNQRSLGVCRIADAIWLFMSPESKEKRKFQILSWLHANVIVLEMILMMHVLRLLLSLCVENEFGGDVVSRSSPADNSRSRWKQRSGPKSCLDPQTLSGSVAHPVVHINLFRCDACFDHVHQLLLMQVCVKNVNCTSFYCHIFHYISFILYFIA